MPPKTTSIRVDEPTLEQLNELLPERLGKRYVLESWPSLYRRTLHDLRGRFTAAELSLMLDSLNGTYLTAGLAGQHIGLNVADSIALDALDAKHGVSAANLTRTLDALTIFESACIEIWCATYWARHADTPHAEYVKELA